MDVMERKRLKLTAVARMKSGGRFPVDTRLCESYHKVGSKENPTSGLSSDGIVSNPPRRVKVRKTRFGSTNMARTKAIMGNQDKKNPLTDGAEPVKGSRLASKTPPQLV